MTLQNITIQIKKVSNFNFFVVKYLLNNIKGCGSINQTSNRKDEQTEHFVLLFQDCNFYILQDCVKKEVNNKNKTIDLYNVSNYLVCLFKKFPIKYSCTPVKIQKMILILHIYYVIKSNGEKTFSTLKKVLLASCGCKLPDVEMCIPNNITEGTIINNKIDITDDLREEMLNYQMSSDNIFNPNLIDLETRNLLIDLFSSFAGYSAKYIGDCFEPIKPNDCKCSEEYEIPISLYNKWIIKNFDNLNNIISTFVKEHLS